MACSFPHTDLARTLQYSSNFEFYQTNVQDEDALPSHTTHDAFSGFLDPGQNGVETERQNGSRCAGDHDYTSGQNSRPITGILNGCKAISRVIRTIFTRSEQRFRIWIVIAHAGSAVRGNDTQILHLSNHSKALLRRTVIRMQHRRIDKAAF
jgi:hypothetical protein